MRRTAITLLALAMVLALAACGSGGDAAQGADPVALGEKLLSQAEDMPDMTVVSSETADGADLFQYLSDMAYDKVAGYYSPMPPPGRPRRSPSSGSRTAPTRPEPALPWSGTWKTAWASSGCTTRSRLPC